MNNLNEMYQKCYILNTLLGIGSLAVTVGVWSYIMKGIKKEQENTQEKVYGNNFW